MSSTGLHAAATVVGAFTPRRPRAHGAVAVNGDAAADAFALLAHVRRAVAQQRPATQTNAARERERVERQRDSAAVAPPAVAHL